MATRYRFPIPLVLAAFVCLLAAIALPPDLHAQGYDYGWRNSTNAGGAAPGEAGGTVRRGGVDFVSFYADRLLGGPLTLENALSATGKIDLENDQGFNSNVYLGWFNSTESEYGFGGNNTPNNVLGFEIRESGSGFTAQRFFESLFDDVQDYADNWPSSRAGYVVQGYNLPRNRNFDFTIDYVPTAGANGRLTVDLLEGGVSAVGGAIVYDLTPEERANGATFNAFGLRQGDLSSDLNQRVDIFWDDLTYTTATGVETQSFDSEESARAAGWIAFNTVDPIPSPPPLLPPPDVNQDTNIDLLDFALIRDNFLSGTIFEQGDVNFDGTVNLVDFSIWKAAAFPSPAGAAVPEPATLVLMGFAAVLLIVRPRRR